MSIYRIILIYLCLMNLAAFLLFGADKRRARRDRWRIRESTLLLAAALGGSVGALAGMRLFRHKTRKRKFSVGVPLILAGQLAVLLLLYRMLSFTL